MGKNVLPQLSVREDLHVAKSLTNVMSASMDVNGIKARLSLTSRGDHTLHFWGAGFELYEVMAYVSPSRLFTPLDLARGTFACQKSLPGWRYEFRVSRARAWHMKVLRATVKFNGPMKTRMDLRRKLGDEAPFSEVIVMGGRMLGEEGVLVGTFRLYPDNALVCTTTKLVRR